MRSLAQQVDHGALCASLDRQRLLPLLGSRLIDVAGGDVPPPFADRVHGRRTQARAAAMRLAAETTAVIELLAAHGIRAVAVKGPGLAESAYGDVGLRQSGDVDLLVSRADLFGAVDVLRRDGFAAPRDRTGSDGLPDLHFRLERDGRASIEVHWRVHWNDDGFSARLLDAAPGDPVNGAALLLFYARDGFYGLRLAADVAGWSDRHLDGAADPALADLAAEHPRLARTWAAAAVAAERTVGVPAAAWLAPRRLDRRATLAVRLSNWNQSGDRDQLAANMAVVDGLLAPAGTHADYVRRVARAVPASKAPAHLAKTAARSAVALWRVRGRWWAPVPLVRCPAGNCDTPLSSV
jgi:hypothetical protein